MKKILLGLAVGLTAAFAPAIESSVILNATNGQVFGVSYETGVATVTVAGVVNATTLSGTTISGSTMAAPAATLGTATVQTNLTVSGRITAATINALTVSTNASVGGTLGVTGIATFAATQTVWSAAAAESTNTVLTSNPALQVRVNGTNYLIKLFPN